MIKNNFRFETKTFIKFLRSGRTSKIVKKLLRAINF